MPFKITAESEKTDELSELERLRAETKILKAQKTGTNGTIILKKISRKEAKLGLIRHESIYQAVKEKHEEHNYRKRQTMHLRINTD